MKGSASSPLTLRDPSGRTLELLKDTDGGIAATLRLSRYLQWTVKVPPKQVEKLREWLG